MALEFRVQLSVQGVRIRVQGLGLRRFCQFLITGMENDIGKKEN